MAKKRITQITVERTALLTTDYIAADSATGTNNTCKISFPNLLAQLSGGPTTPTFQVKLSTLATAGLGGVSRLARGFDIHLTNPKATTAAVEYGLQVASNDAASPLALRFGVTTHLTPGSRNGIIEVDDAGTKRPLILQPTGGFVGVNTISPQATLHVLKGGAAATPAIGAATVATFQLSSGAGSIAAMSLVSGNAGQSRLLFGDTDGEGVGGIYYDNLNNRMLFRVNNLDSRLVIDLAGNVGIGTSTFGAGAVKVAAFGNGTIPGTIADGFQLVSADVVAGQAAPHFVIENGPVIRLYQQAHIADPAAGGTVDAEARTAINAILVALENTRLLAAA